MRCKFVVNYIIDIIGGPKKSAHRATGDFRQSKIRAPATASTIRHGTRLIACRTLAFVRSNCVRMTTPETLPCSTAVKISSYDDRCSFFEIVGNLPAVLMPKIFSDPGKGLASAPSRYPFQLAKITSLGPKRAFILSVTLFVASNVKLAGSLPLGMPITPVPL